MSTIQGGHLARVQAAYRMERAAAQVVSPFRLRWKYRQLRRLDELDDIGMAQLRAVREEFEDRGLRLPK